MSAYGTEHLDSAMCGCGHMRGIHKARDPHGCATAGCRCASFHTRAASPEPPRVIPGRVERELPAGNGGGRLDDVAFSRREPPQDPVKNFAVHLAARMRALGWDQATLREKSGLSLHVLGRAMNGNGAELGAAHQVAGVVGSTLAVMIGPYSCGTCAGEPPAGFACLECGAEARQP